MDVHTIDSDLSVGPQITRADIAAAFSGLKRHDAVIGPAEDGGYWLGGLSPRALRADPFADVAWSSPCALADTVANLPKSHSIAILDMLNDVDVGVDHALWRTRWRQVAEI